MTTAAAHETTGPWRRAVLVLAVLVLAAAGWLAWSTGRSAMLWRAAEQAAWDEHWDQAEAALARLAWYRPGDLEALRLRIYVATRRGRPEQTARLLAQVPASAPNAAEARLARARLLMELFRLREAESALRDALGIDPLLNDARRLLITILAVQRRTGEYEDALWDLHDHGQPLEALRLLTQAEPTIPPGALSRTADEGQILEQSLEVEPDHPHTRPALAYFYRNRGRLDHALGVLEPWLSTHPDDPEARIEWLACLLDEGRLDDARPWFESPDPSLTDRGRYWAVRGDWYRERGQLDQAIASFQRAVTLAPRDPQLRYRLGQALLASGRAEDAEPHLKIAQQAFDLKETVARIDDTAPDPALMARAAELCQAMARDREARAWQRLIPH